MYDYMPECVTITACNSEHRGVCDCGVTPPYTVNGVLCRWGSWILRCTPSFIHGFTVPQRIPGQGESLHTDVQANNTTPENMYNLQSFQNLPLPPH